MKLAILIFSVVSAAVLINGCSPDLAQTPLSEEENQWKHYLKDNYPGWEPPQTIIPENLDVAPGAKAVKRPAEVVSHDTVAVPNDYIEDSEPNFEQEGSVVVNEPVTEKKNLEFLSHTVKKGDTLSAIAKKYYNKASAWKKIQEANADLIPNPNQLKLGITLRIPQP
ncbi:MAG: LysM peptidoglycan-binding domain-containing protein [Victivallaceae bacterium]|nr:LysM peptidoglycan-binding domain-containing protein [Victivallaceae bacterium]